MDSVYQVDRLSGRWPPLLAGWFGRLQSKSGSLALEQVLALDARRRLCIVRCDRRRVLLLLGGGQDLVVGWLDAVSGDGDA